MSEWNPAVTSWDASKEFGLHNPVGDACGLITFASKVMFDELAASLPPGWTLI